MFNIKKIFMKKYLLLSAAACVATVGVAQKYEKFQQPKVNKVSAASFQQMELATKDNVAKSYTNQTYYVPQGTYYLGWSETGQGSGSSFIFGAPFSNVVYQNMCNNPLSTSWVINGTDVSQYYATEEGNFKNEYGPNFFAYVPTLINGAVQYQFGENAYYYKVGQIKNVSEAGGYATTPAISFNDIGEVNLGIFAMNDHGSRSQDNRFYQNTLAGYGFLNGTKFLFGTGTVTMKDETGGSYTTTATGFYQPFGAPGADLYIENVFAKTFTFNKSGAIPAGEKLNLYITSVDTLQREDGRIVYTPGNEIFATMVATSDDITTDPSDAISGWAAEGAYAGLEPVSGTIKFYNAETDKDPLTGAESPRPVVIPQGKSFALLVSGLDNPKINIGLGCIMSNDEDAGANGYVVTEDGNLTYSGRLGVNMGINGMFEKIHIVSKDFFTAESQTDFPAGKFNGWNVLRASNDGQTIDTDGLSGTNYSMNVVFVGTACPWVDADDTQNYAYEIEYLSGGEDWITDLMYNDQYYENSTENIQKGLNGYNLVQPVASALPAGVSGRAAKITFYGKGDVKSDNSIYVLQGDADYKTAGINNAVVVDKKGNMSNRIYNINGQQVSKDYKGLVIKNGKKMLVK